MEVIADLASHWNLDARDPNRLGNLGFGIAHEPQRARKGHFE